MLLQCGSERFPFVTVALLGRFLPRLGPLPQGERPFFLSGFFKPFWAFGLAFGRRPSIPPRRRGRAATPRSGSWPGGLPALRIRRQAWRARPSARNVAR